MQPNKQVSAGVPAVTEKLGNGVSVHSAEDTWLPHWAEFHSGRLTTSDTSAEDTVTGLPTPSVCSTSIGSWCKLV